MKRHRYLIIALTVILAGALFAENCRAEGKGPIKEPVYESPRVYTNSNGKVVFKEFFEGLTVTRIEFFDPDSGELLYGASLQAGRQVGDREGSGAGEVVEDPLNERWEIVEHKYFTHSGKTVLVIREHKGELVEYKALGRGMNNPLTVSIELEKGRIIYAQRKFILNNEVVDFRRNFAPDTYEELYFHDDGSKISREYKSGFLHREGQSIPDEGGGKLAFYNSAHYLRGEHAFTIKNKFNKENFKEEIAIYDADDKLIGKANPVLGENLYLKEQTVNGRKALQVIRLGQDLQEKVEAMKFED